MDQWGEVGQVVFPAGAWVEGSCSRYGFHELCSFLKRLSAFVKWTTRNQGVYLETFSL